MSRAHKLTRRSVICGVALALIPAREVFGKPPFARKGAPANITAAGAITTQTVANTAAATSSGYKVEGHVFKIGDVPAGTYVEKQIGGATVDAQFDKFNYWPDGSLRRCSSTSRYATFGANESRTVSLVKKTGSFSNSSLSDAALIAAIAAETNFHVDLSSIVGSTSGSIANHSASFNTHAAVATRVERKRSGPIVDEIKVWGMFSESGTEHLHLKVTWYVKRFKDAGGNLAYYEVLPVLQQDWWTNRGTQKEKFTYNAALLNGATSLSSYSGVHHIYGMWWAMVRQDNDFQHATPITVGAAKPTLHYTPNFAYWRSTDLVPPIDPAPTYVMVAGYLALNTYIPGSNFAHRQDIPGTGTYQGRGIIPNSSCLAMMAPTAANLRAERCQAFAGHHLPVHRKTETMRTRPGESADIANTFPPDIFKDERGASTPTSYYDFQAQGMPAPFTYSTFQTSLTQGWGTITGGTTTAGGATTWGSPFDLSHVPAFAIFIALWEGETHFDDEVINQAPRAYQDQLAAGQGTLAWSMWYDPIVSDFGGPADDKVYPGASSTQWAGICMHGTNGNATRAQGWSLNILRCGYMVCDVNDPQSLVLNRAMEVNAKYLATDFPLIPAGIKGSYLPWWNFVSLWHDAFLIMCEYMAYGATRDPNWLIPANHMLYQSIEFVDADMVGMADNSHAVNRGAHRLYWNAITNPFYVGAGGATKHFDIRERATNISASTNRITAPRFYGSPWVVGDEMVWVDDANLAAPPSEVTVGTIYYVSDPIGDTFKLARNPDGTDIVVFTSNYTANNICCRSSKQNDPTSRTTWGNGVNDRGCFAMACMALGMRFGHPDVNLTKVNKYYSFYHYANDFSSFAVWNLRHDA